MKRIPNPRDLRPGDRIVWSLTGDECTINRVIGSGIEVLWPSGALIVYHAEDSHWQHFRREQVRKVYRMARQSRKVTRPGRMSRAQQERQYVADALAYKIALQQLGAQCPVAWKLIGVKFPINQVHHMAGREGPLLLDKRHWLGVSQWGHDWIRDHPDKAREHGWLYEVFNGRKSKR